MPELTATAPVETLANILAVKDAYSRAWADRDPARIASLHTEDTTFRMHMGTPPVLGRVAMQDACADLFETYKSFTVTGRSFLCGDSHWVLEWTLSATMSVERDGKETDVPVTVDCVDVVVLSDAGLVASKDTYLDVAHVNAVMSQL
jgi:uncharacterized protein (TIGR02246 family)